jgi:hypothetical protein
VKLYEFAEPIRNTDKFCFIPRELSSANLAEPTGDNLLQEENRLQTNCSPSLTLTTAPAFFFGGTNRKHI